MSPRLGRRKPTGTQSLLLLRNQGVKDHAVHDITPPPPGTDSHLD